MSPSESSEAGWQSSVIDSNITLSATKSSDTIFLPEYKASGGAPKCTSCGQPTGHTCNICNKNICNKCGQFPEDIEDLRCRNCALLDDTHINLASRNPSQLSNELGKRIEIQNGTVPQTFWVGIEGEDKWKDNQPILYVHSSLPGGTNLRTLFIEGNFKEGRPRTRSPIC